MKIKRFSTTSPLFEGVDFDELKPVCVFSKPPMYLYMMRYLLDGEGDEPTTDELGDPLFVSSVVFSLDGEDVELCGVLCEDQRFFLAVKDDGGFSARKTRRIVEKLRCGRSNVYNSYLASHEYGKANRNHTGREQAIENFKSFIEVVRAETEKGDVRPVFVSDFFERLDEATDVTPFLDLLHSLGRQVFISVSGRYPVARLARENVQIV